MRPSALRVPGLAFVGSTVVVVAATVRVAVDVVVAVVTLDVVDEEVDDVRAGVRVRALFAGVVGRLVAGLAVVRARTSSVVVSLGCSVDPLAGGVVVVSLTSTAVVFVVVGLAFVVLATVVVVAVTVVVVVVVVVMAFVVVVVVVVAFVVVVHPDLAFKKNTLVTSTVPKPVAWPPQICWSPA